MKKLLCLTLALLMLFGMVACGNNGNAPASSTPTGSEPESTVSTTDAPATTVATTNTTVAATTTTKKPTAVPTKPAIAVGGGTFSDDRWENEAVKLCFTAPAGWTFTSRKDLDNMNNITADSLDNEQLAEAIRNAQLYYDMMATDDKGNSVNVVFEKLSQKMTDSQYITAALPNIKAAYEQLYDNVKVEKANFLIDGQVFVGLKTSFTTQGITMYMAQLISTIDTTAVAITIGTVNTDSTATLLKNFHLL